MTNVVGRFDAAAPNDPVSHLGRLHFLATASQNVSIAGYRQCASRLSTSRIALGLPKPHVERGQFLRAVAAQIHGLCPHA